MRPQTEIDLEPLLLDPDGPSVVAVGGGHGQAAALEAIQAYAGRIAALVAVADDGGSSGRLAPLGIPPPGDVRRCLLALTPEPSLWSELFAHRFRDGDIADHSLGNLILAALSDLFGDFASAVKTAERMLGCLGSVIPVTNTPVTLEATIDDRLVLGQVDIMNSEGLIRDIGISPTNAMATREALAAVAEARQIVIGPGSLYTSLISALLVQMLAPAVMNSSAQLVFVLNLVTQKGETSGLTGYDHLRALSQHVGLTGPGVVIANKGQFELPPNVDAVTLTELDAIQFGWNLVEADVVDPTGAWPQHDPLKLGRVLEAQLDSQR